MTALRATCIVTCKYLAGLFCIFFFWNTGFTTSGGKGACRYAYDNKMDTKTALVEDVTPCSTKKKRSQSFC